MTNRHQSFDANITKHVHLDYLLHLPRGYAAGGGPWPLILFLHGAGERGEELALVKKHGLPKRLEQGDDDRFIVVSPQCPSRSLWPMHFDALIALLDDVQARYDVDPKRVYLTGLSMGGHGTWGLAITYPHRFAAIAPVCAPALWQFNLPRDAHVLKHLPVWAFHGARDEVAPVWQQAHTVEMLRSLGADIRFTIYPGADHDSWTAAYDTHELYTWLLSHSL